MTQRVMWMMILACGAMLGCETPKGPKVLTPRPKAKTVASANQLKKLGLQYYWTGRVPLRSGEKIMKMWAVADLLYFLTDQQNLYAFDAQVGIPMWAVNVTTKKEPIFAPSFYRGMRMSPKVGTVKDIEMPPPPGDLDRIDATLINTATRMVVIDKKGKVWRDFAFGTFSSSAQVCTDGWEVYTPSPTKMAYGVRLNEAVTSWRDEINGGLITVPIVTHGKSFFVGTMDGDLQVRDLENGDRVWNRELPGEIATPFHVDGRGIFVACGDKNIYGINSEGTSLWYPCTVKGEFVGPLLATDRSLLQQVEGEGLYCVNITNGKARWSNAALRNPAAVIDGNIYCYDADGNIQIVNEITGKVSGVIPTVGMDFVPTNLRAPAVYGATAGGTVYCIRKADAGMLTVEDLQGK